MTHKQRKHPENASSDPPTSRDAIESWLDVLTSMLSLPPSQRTQVRDELEDHLRSRVDDLLITGQTEPKAVRTAIAELGETAQLARHISSANRTPKSFRRFAMNATFFILAGSILTASVSMMMPTAAMNSSVAVESETANVIETATQSNDPLSDFTIDVRKGTIADLCKKIDSNTDRPLIVHWDPLSEIGFERDTSIEIDADPISARLALTILAERSERNMGDPIAILEMDDRIEIGTRSQFDRRTTEKRLYDLSVFASDDSIGRQSGAQSNRAANDTRQSMQRITELLQSHINPSSWRNLGGDIASATVLDTTLVVSAPERMHAEIHELLTDLVEQHNAAQREQHIQRQIAMERIRAEYEAAKREYLAKSNEASRLELRGRQIQLQADQAEPGSEQYDSAQAELADLAGALQVLRLETQEQERRFNSLQSLLLDTERDSLMHDLN